MSILRWDDIGVGGIGLPILTSWWRENDDGRDIQG